MRSWWDITCARKWHPTRLISTSSATSIYTPSNPGISKATLSLSLYHSSGTSSATKTKSTLLGLGLTELQLLGSGKQLGETKQFMTKQS
ncbi:unnamed protein product [Linum tenue]|uniref:Uncharacterized protein n=1 Tax=Linum tenue TaxID=586396 RepID=A0AAV0NT35_9ROSI|nr:unnamed protein product [Linum tenue]